MPNCGEGCTCTSHPIKAINYEAYGGNTCLSDGPHASLQDPGLSCQLCRNSDEISAGVLRLELLAV